MAVSRSKLATLNFLSSVVLFSSSIVISLVLTPYIISGLGDESFGSYRTLLDWFGHLALFELGFEGALIALVAKAHNSGDKDGVKGALSAGFTVFLVVITLKFLAAFLLTVWITDLIPISPEGEQDLVLAGIIATTSILFGLIAPLRVMIRVAQRSYFLNITLAVQTILVGVLSVVFARGGLGVSGQMAATIAGVVLYSVCLVAGFYSVNQSIKIRQIVVRPQADQIRSLIRSNWPVLVMDTSTRVSTMTDNIFIAYFLGPAYVMPLYLAQRLPQIFQRVLVEVANASWAGLVDMYHKDEAELFRKRVLELTELVSVLGMSGMISILALNETFVRLWVDRPDFEADTLTWLSCGTAFLLTITTLWRWFFIGTGLVQRISWITALQLVANLTLSLLLVQFIGISGPVLATLLGMFFLFVALPYSMERSFGIAKEKLLGAALRPVLYSLPFVVLYKYLMSWVAPDNWVTLIGGALLGPVLFLTAVYFWGIDRTNRQLWKERLWSAFRR